MSKRWPSSTDRAQREILPLSLALYHAARDYVDGIKGVAAVQGLNHITLQHKLSPTHAPHRANIDDLEAVLAVTQDHRILDSIGEIANGVVWVRPSVAHAAQPAIGMMASLAALQDSVAALVRTLNESLEDEVIHPHEARELHLRVRRLFEAALGVEAASVQYHEGEVANG